MVHIVSPDHADADSEPAERAAAVRLSDAWHALALLTAAPLPAPPIGSDAFGRATLFFAPAGLLVGAALLGIDRLAVESAGAWTAALIVVVAWELLTAARPSRALAQISGTEHGLGIALCSAVKLLAVVPNAQLHPAALLFAPMLGRWSMVVLGVGARDARHPGRKFCSAIGFGEFAWSSVFAFAVVFTLTDAVGILIVLALASITVLMRLLLHRVGGGVTWTWMLATAALAEVVVLGLFALL